MYGKILLMAGACVLAILFFIDPGQSGLFPRCPFLQLTGWKCPGCGSQREVHALTHGELGRALSHNALLVMALPYVLLGFWLEWLGGKKRYPDFARRWFGPEAAKFWLVLVTVWWLGRNLFNW